MLHHLREFINLVENFFFVINALIVLHFFLDLSFRHCFTFLVTHRQKTKHNTIIMKPKQLMTAVAMTVISKFCVKPFRFDVWGSHFGCRLIWNSGKLLLCITLWMSHTHLSWCRWFTDLKFILIKNAQWSRLQFNLINFIKGEIWNLQLQFNKKSMILMSSKGNLWKKLPQSQCAQRMYWFEIVDNIPTTMP